MTMYISVVNTVGGHVNVDKYLPIKTFSENTK